MTRPTAPHRLIQAMDIALDKGERLPPDVVHDVFSWLQTVILHIGDKPATLTASEVMLIAHALGDALQSPIHEIEEAEDECPGPGNLHAVRLGTPEYYCAACHKEDA